MRLLIAPKSNSTLGQQFTLAAARPSYSSTCVARILGVRVAPVHQGVGFLPAAGINPARPMQFEASPDEPHAVREQRGGQRVARMTVHGPAVEFEGQLPRSVDPLSVGCPEPR